MFALCPFRVALWHLDKESWLLVLGFNNRLLVRSVLVLAEDLVLSPDNFDKRVVER